jgi:hypothetical protein
MSGRIPRNLTLPVTEPISIRPMLVVGEGDTGELHAWCPPDMARVACPKLREQILAAARELLESLERPRG